jgi:hypothetical protein
MGLITVDRYVHSNRKEVQEKFSCRGIRGVPKSIKMYPNVWGTDRGVRMVIPPSLGDTRGLI